MARKTKTARKSVVRKGAARKSAPRKSMAPRAKAVAKPSNGHDKSGAHDSLREVEQLLFRQAECLDGKRWQDFIELFTDDGTYWMPAAPEQTTGDGVPSIFWDVKCWTFSLNQHFRKMK